MLDLFVFRSFELISVTSQLQTQVTKGALCQSACPLLFGSLVAVPSQHGGGLSRERGHFRRVDLTLTSLFGILAENLRSFFKLSHSGVFTLDVSS